MSTRAPAFSSPPDPLWPPEPQRPPPDFPPAWACAWGDDGYGLWMDIEVSGVVQRLRWIEPGEFWMGSPEGEVGRSRNEGPLHKVRLTRGFWLADTACTQRLWEAVMERNPSYTMGDLERPVESVSWNEIQQFLRRLERQLGEGVQRADLPTEAEWEYACRGGIPSPAAYSFGSESARNAANVGREKGSTVPVKSYGANAWGLYQMHGNVWEWCADGQRAYDGLGQVDPRGPEAQVDWAVRVVRGGAWDDGVRAARSAYRLGRQRGARSINLGFRLALRFPSPGGATE